MATDDTPETAGNSFASSLGAFSKIADATLLIAFTTAILYFLNLTYLSTLYATFGLSIGDFTFPMPDTLVASPRILVAVMVLAILGVGDRKRKYLRWLLFDFTSLENTVRYITSCFLVLMFAASLSAWLDAHSRFDSEQLDRVSFVSSGVRVEGYSLLTKNAENYFFYRTVAGQEYPEIKIIAASDVHDLTIRPSPTAEKAVSPVAEPKAH